MIPFNLNLDFKNIDKVLNSPLLWVLIAISIGAILGSVLSSTHLDKQSICKDEFTLISTQASTIDTLEAELAECIAAGEISCIDREKRLCRIEKENIKANCDALLDRIVKDCKK
jgi:hypothetical protein